MVGHTFEYNPAVQELRNLVRAATWAASIA